MDPVILVEDGGAIVLIPVVLSRAVQKINRKATVRGVAVGINRRRGGVQPRFVELIGLYLSNNPGLVGIVQ